MQRELIRLELKRVMAAKELLLKLVKEELPENIEDSYRKAIFFLQLHEDKLIDELQEEPNE